MSSIAVLLLLVSMELVLDSRPGSLVNMLLNELCCSEVFPFSFFLLTSTVGSMSSSLLLFSVSSQVSSPIIIIDKRSSTIENCKYRIIWGTLMKDLLKV